MAAQVQKDGVSEADVILDKVDRKTSSSLDLVQQFMERQQAAVEDARKIADPTERKKKLDLLNAQFAQVRTEVEGDKKDIAAAVAAFLAKEHDLDVQLGGLEDYTPFEQAQLTEAESAVTLAKGQVEQAKTANTWFGFADPKAKAATALKDAETKLEALKDKLKKRVRESVMSANFEQSLMTLQLRGVRTLNALHEHKKVLTIQLGIATLSREESYKLSQSSQKNVDVAKQKLETLEAQVSANVDRLERLDDQSQEHIQLMGETAELKRRVEEARNEHTAALGVKNEATKDAIEYETSETSFIQTIGAIDAMAHVTEVKNRNMPKKRELYVKLLAGSAVQEISTTLAHVGDTSQLKMQKRTAEAGAAAVHSRQEFYEAQPARIRERIEVRQAQNEALIDALKKDEDIMAALREASVDVERVFASNHTSGTTDKAAA